LRAFLVGKRKRKYRSDYEKAVSSAQRYFDYLYSPDRFWRTFQSILEWLAGIPTALTYETRVRQLQNIHYKVLEYVGLTIARDVERIGRKEYPERFRPVFVTIASKLPEAVFKRMSLREFAGRLGVSWRTVRDALWYMRRIGFELPLVVLPYR